MNKTLSPIIISPSPKKGEILLLLISLIIFSLVLSVLLSAPILIQVLGTLLYIVTIKYIITLMFHSIVVDDVKGKIFFGRIFSNLLINTVSVKSWRFVVYQQLIGGGINRGAVRVIPTDMIECWLQNGKHIIYAIGPSAASMDNGWRHVFVLCLGKEKQTPLISAPRGIASFRYGFWFLFI